MKTWLRSALAVSCVLGVIGTFSARGADVQFETLSSEATGIGTIFKQWYDEEMKRQGGPGKESHGWWPWGLRAVDFDRDGDLDLLASHHGVPHSIVLKSLFRESGKFQFVNFTTELGVDHRDLPGADDRPWIWDFDGDGWLDVAGFSDESKPKSAWNQQGTTFALTAGPLFPGLSHPREVIDLDGDGYLDLDGGKNGQWFYVPDQRTFRHDRTPRFAMPKDLPEEVLTEVREQSKSANRFFYLNFLTHDEIGYDTLGYAPRPIDLNGDGRDDLVIQGSGGYGAIYLGRYLLRESTGKLADQTLALGLPTEGAPILIDDLTGDGRTDLLIVGDKTGGLYVQNERGTFDRRDNTVTGFLQKRGPYLLRAWRADFDNDGDPDLVLSNPRGGKAAAFENRGNGEFAKLLDVPAWDSNPIVIADLNDDGRLDLAIGGGGSDKERGLQITLYLNSTHQVGNYGKIVPRMAAPNPFAVGAVAEVFPAGGLDDPKLRPLKIEKAHSDGTPIHVGLGAATTYDLRVTFPQGKTVESRQVPVNAATIVDLTKDRAPGQ